MDRAVAREGWKIVLLTRLAPVFPFNFLNYAYGLTGVGLRPYLAASAIGILPGTLLYIYIGATAAGVAQAASGDTGTLEVALRVVGLLAVLAVTVFITRIARRALREAGVEESSPN